MALQGVGAGEKVPPPALSVKTNGAQKLVKAILAQIDFSQSRNAKMLVTQKLA